MNFSIEPLAMYLHDKDGNVICTEDFSTVAKPEMLELYSVYIWSDEYCDYVDITKQLKTIVNKITKQKRNKKGTTK